jgi:phosphotriesterase-related protein
MWDPRNYDDTDFGLEEGESFEPEDAWEWDDVDTTQPHVMTVLGPIPPDALGTCQPHEHILSNPTEAFGVDNAYRLDRLDLASQELESYFTSGGRSMVDASTMDYGRDLAGLVTIARQVPVNIVAVTGRHKHQFASHMPHALDIDALKAEIESDLDAATKPGVIKFGSSLNEITDVERIAGLAAASVAVTRGYPVTTHTEAGTMAHEQLDLVESAGLSPKRVMVGHLDRKLDFDYLASIARRGAWLSFDQVGKARFGEDQPRAEMIVRLAEAGYADQLLISQDLARTDDFVAYGGGPGWIHLIERFTLELMEQGAEAMLVRQLLIENPAEALTIYPPEPRLDPANPL